VVDNIDFRTKMTDKTTTLPALRTGVGQIAPVNGIDDEVIRATVRQTFAIKAD
jgi:hypothetical protein